MAEDGPVHHFVNGGGGAYLSIGGALAWPEALPTRPGPSIQSADAVRAKLDAETPAWKQPFWWWIKRFGAWPLDIETLSGMFDFNHAPFYQSFMEVRVERSKKQVLLLLHGVNGPVRWRDLHVSPGAGFVGKSDEPVQFTVEMTGSSSAWSRSLPVTSARHYGRYADSTICTRSGLGVGMMCRDAPRKFSITRRAHPPLAAGFACSSFYGMARPFRPAA